MCCEQEKMTEEVCAALISQGVTLAAAESCTGGLFSAKVTDVPGVSKVFCGGIVCYTDAVKERAVGVPAALLKVHGAVSEPVCRALCQGVRERLGADLGISFTGVAGPDSDDRGNPVGLIYVGLSDGEYTDVRMLRLSGSRVENRNSACQMGFAMLRDYLSR